MTGIHNSTDNTHTSFSVKVGVVYQHNTVVNHNTNGHYRSHHCHNTHRSSRNNQTNKHSHKCKRNGKHNNERIGKTLKLRSHYNEYQNYNQNHQKSQALECAYLVIVSTSNLPTYTCRKAGLLNLLRNSLVHITGCHTLRKRCGNGDISLTVFTINCRRSQSLNNGSQFTQLNCLTL